MKLFLDTANTLEWAPIAGCAAIQGVTTNPTLVVQAGLKVDLPHYDALVLQARQRGMAQLMLQLPSAQLDDALHWAQHLSAQASSPADGAAPTALTFKMPCHPSWQSAHTALKNAGFSTLLTGVSNPVQLMWAHAQGADYVAPYLSRLATAGKEIDVFIQALLAVQNAGGPKVMAASVKTEALFASLLANNAYACTVKPSFLAAMVHDAVTDQAVAQFAKDCALNEVREK